MARAHKDIGAMLLTALAVVVLAATDRGWDVPLVGASHRWAAGAVLVLGMAACSLGSSRSGAGAWLLAGLGAVSLVLVAVAIATGSLQALELAVAAFVALWVGSTLRHMPATGGGCVLLPIGNRQIPDAPAPAEVCNCG